jgi:pimeloyl-ACP methyl ester carboxylesterase
MVNNHSEDSPKDAYFMRSFDEIYADVPTHQRESLRQFRDTHPEKTLTINGADWRYIVSGQGEHTLLLLVGGLREADAAHANITILEKTFRVITPSYPAIHTMDDLSDGIATILMHEDAEKVHVLAGSFGGMLAQVFIRRHPELVHKVILSTTAVLDDESASRYTQALTMVEDLSPEQVAEAAKLMMFETMQPPQDQHAFYRAYLDELYSYRVDKAGIMSLYRALLDFSTHDALNSTWDGQMFILESEDDGTFDERVRDKVRKLYPHAESYAFKNAGHSPASSQPDLYFKMVRDYLLR